MKNAKKTPSKRSGTKPKVYITDAPELEIYKPHLTDTTVSLFSVAGIIRGLLKKLIPNKPNTRAQLEVGYLTYLQTDNRYLESSYLEPSVQKILIRDAENIVSRYFDAMKRHIPLQMREQSNFLLEKIVHYPFNGSLKQREGWLDRNLPKYLKEIKISAICHEDCPQRTSRPEQEELEQMASQERTPKQLVIAILAFFHGMPLVSVNHILKGRGPK